jgi:hypothetical protein
LGLSATEGTVIRVINSRFAIRGFGFESHL